MIMNDLNEINIPERLRVCQVTRNEHFYQNLQGKTLLNEEKTWITEKIFNQELTIKNVVNRYKIKSSTIDYWLKRVKDGKYLHDVWHRPRIISEESMPMIRNEILENQFSQSPIIKANFETIVKKAEKQTLLSRNVPEKEAEERINKRRKYHHDTLNYYQKENGVAFQKAREITKARYQAMINPRVSLTWAVALMTFGGHLAPEYKWNSDATTIEIKAKGKDSRVCVIKTYNEVEIQPLIKSHAIKSQIGISKEVSSDLSVYIKWLHMCNAAGHLSDFVLVIAIDNMPENSFYPCRVPGFTHSKDPGDGGYILFSKSKCGNPQLWQWYFINIVIPTISRTQTNFGLKVEFNLMIV